MHMCVNVHTHTQILRLLQSLESDGFESWKTARTVKIGVLEREKHKYNIEKISLYSLLSAAY